VTTRETSTSNPRLATSVSPPQFESRIPFRKIRIHAAALYCSDGRVGDQIDEFLRHILEIPRFDRLVVPGGPASLSQRPRAPEETKAIKEQLSFLVRAHGLRQVVLVAHSPCAFYRRRLEIPDSLHSAHQLEDLKEAAHLVRALAPLTVDAYIGRVVRARVQFYAVSV